MSFCILQFTGDIGETIGRSKGCQNEMEHIGQVRYFQVYYIMYWSFRSASDVAMATKQLRTVLEKGKISLAEVDRKVLHTTNVMIQEVVLFPVTGGAHI